MTLTANAGVLCANLGDTYAAVTARSYHTGGVNALLLDGSVHFCAGTVRPDVWRALSTRAGGEVPGDSFRGRGDREISEVDGRTVFRTYQVSSGQIHGRSRTSLSEARDRLVRLYEAWGKPEEAKAWRAKLG
jgi:prepilin-type processing-associated H-X9-DG protein